MRQFAAELDGRSCVEDRVDSGAKHHWYLWRLACMGGSEILTRMRDEARKRRWRQRQVRDVRHDPLAVPEQIAPFAGPLPASAAHRIDRPAVNSVRECAEAILAGRWRVFACERNDITPCPDWFLDPRTGRRAPSTTYCFDLDHRDRAAMGDIKYVWELSRHHHLTVLATAYFLTHDVRYAEAIQHQLTSWWNSNPYLSGVNWTSGIELGMRLLAWAWIRRLLHAWGGAPLLFECNALFVKQLFHHQHYLTKLHSHGSSAGNHLLVEMAGLFVSCCAFPYFTETDQWRDQAKRTLRREIPRQTYPCGLNRELATDYHAYVLELCLAAALEGETSRHGLGESVWGEISRMTDAAAAMLDANGMPPRQGDSDCASALLLDTPGFNRWHSLLSTGDALFGKRDWWPDLPRTDIRTALWTSLVQPVPCIKNRAARRPCIFPEAGMAFLRHRSGRADEIWCRCDHGPHGLAPLAAHAHADALSIEVRYGGVQILADPGTYCYYGLDEWRAYFRSTLGHNTVELARSDQSVARGPFLWSPQAESKLLEVVGLYDGDVAEWAALHVGYQRLKPAATHRRTVRLDRTQNRLTIKDTIQTEGTHALRLAFHFGPSIRCTLDGSDVYCAWSSNVGEHSATMRLPALLQWDSYRGQEKPPLGWYSPTFDHKVPAVTLIGSGTTEPAQELISELQFH